VRLVSHIFDVFAWTPLSFGHFELMQGYNVPALNMLPELLGRKPSALGSSSGFIRDSNPYFADKSALTKGMVLVT
jgi:hypothetical protein